MTSVQKYIDAFSKVFAREESAEIRYLQFLVGELVKTRNARVVELESKNMQEARLLMERVFGLPLGALLACLCIDGRVLMETVFGLSGVSFRTPAADISDALCMENGDLYLTEGDFTNNIRERVKEYGKVIILLDSHSHCAAKGEEEKSACGVPASDNGLLNDVKRKKHIAFAIRDFANRIYGDEGNQKVIVIQTSFDVEHGFLLLGLDQDRVLSESRVTQGGFTEATLEELAREKKVLSTALFAENGGILSDLCEDAKRRVGIIDFRHDYDASMHRLWTYIADVQDVATAHIHQELMRVFPDIARDSDEFRVRTAILLSNTFLGFLLNIGGVYPYGKHQEGVVVVTKFARGPYGTASPFPVSGYSNGGVAILSFVINFAASIVRGNRSNGRFPEGEQSFIEKCFGGDADAFVKSPVPVFISERVHGDVSNNNIEALIALKWEDVSWSDMSSDDMSLFLRKGVPNISEGVIESIIRLRDRALDLHRPNLPATQHLLSGQLALVSLIRTEAGKVIALFPFILRGYSKEYLKHTGKIH
ncbi:MAG: hypothetical protein WAU31_02885 [Candidatus Moraniibacteriota bacterium]